jgi:hypothetical protein
MLLSLGSSFSYTARYLSHAHTPNIISRGSSSDIFQGHSLPYLAEYSIINFLAMCTSRYSIMPHKDEHHTQYLKSLPTTHYVPPDPPVQSRHPSLFCGTKSHRLLTTLVATGLKCALRFFQMSKLSQTYCTLA